MAERTKKWIAEAAKKLLVHKPIESIHVTEICRAAEIKRPTFYYHFKDKHELMAWIFIEASRGTNVLDIDSLTKSMEAMRKNFVYFKRAYEDRSQNPMWAYILEYFAEKYSNLAKERLGVDTLDPRTRFSLRLYCYGTLGMTREWLLKDNVTPARTVVEMMFSSMPQALRDIFFGVTGGGTV